MRGTRRRSLGISRALRQLVIFGVGAAVWAALGAESRADESARLTVFPPAIHLEGPDASQRLIAQRTSPSGEFQRELRSGLEWSSSDESVVVVRDGHAVAVADGEASLVARFGDAASDEGGASTPVAVRVRGTARPRQVSFENHVLAVLSKNGCNSGACHGAIAGQNGFRLSLRGYDPAADFRSITRGARGRRVVRAEPGRSLLLTKPTGRLPHKGGVLFEDGSGDYDVVAGWIAAGARPPSPGAPRLEGIDLFPPSVTLAPGDEQQLIVVARYDDGHREDVTQWTKFEATRSAVATVSDDGNVTVHGFGEGAVTAWFGSRIVVATITSPYDRTVPAAAPVRNFIDEAVGRKLASLRIPVSPRADDATFLRRAYLDTIGVLPTLGEVKAFLDDDRLDKRDRLVDSLLERDEFVDLWTYKLSDLLLVSSRRLQAPAMWSYYRWIRDRVAANAPWDEFVRELVTATGSTLENGATNFFVLHEDPSDMAETTSLAFLGMAIGCAKCHNHPMEKWTNDQYFAMTNLFARVRMKDAGGSGHRIVFNAPRGDVVQPLTGRPRPPQPLDGEPLPLGSDVERRGHLASWLTSPENPYFTRAIANRIWAHFLGVGLVERIDDLRLTNPASNEELLASLAAYLVEQRYDLRALMRAILRSETYQRSSEPVPGNETDSTFHSRFYPRRLIAEVMLDAWSQVTGVPTRFANYPEGWRAVQLPDSNVGSYFLSSFGRPERKLTCSCERSEEPSVSQLLHIANGDTLNGKLEAASSRIAALAASGADDRAVVDELYLSALSRFPSEEERTRLLEALGEESGSDRASLIQDVFWSVLSSRAFLFQH